MPLRAFPIFLSWALACGTNWASAVASEAPPACFAGDDGASCLLEEPHGAAEAEDQDFVSQLQTVAGGRRGKGGNGGKGGKGGQGGAGCEKLIPEVTKTCNFSQAYQCVGRFDNEGSVVKLPADDSCLKGVPPRRTGAHVYEFYNDVGSKVGFEAANFCLPPSVVDFDYAISCFGDVNGTCKDTGCMNCNGGVESPPGVSCDFEPGETKYVAIWFETKPRCSKLAPNVTKVCDISDLTSCMGTIDNTDPVETKLDGKCAQRAKISNPSAKVYKVTNDKKKEVSLNYEDFCFGPPGVDFNYAISCDGNDSQGSCENQGCASCQGGVATDKCNCWTCTFKPGQTKYITIWFEAAP